MEIKRGPRGYKMVHADVGVCDTIVGQGYTGHYRSDQGLRAREKFPQTN